MIKRNTTANSTAENANLVTETTQVEITPTESTNDSKTKQPSSSDANQLQEVEL